MSNPIHNSYFAVAASQTNKVLGATGAAGDAINRIIIIPATTTPGAVTIKDGSGSSITVFAGGTLADVASFDVELGMRSTGGAWTVTTGANVSIIAIGSFT